MFRPNLRRNEGGVAGFFLRIVTQCLKCAINLTLTVKTRALSYNGGSGDESFRSLLTPLSRPIYWAVSSLGRLRLPACHS